MNQSENGKLVFHIDGGTGNRLGEVLKEARRSSSGNEEILIVIKEGDYYFERPVRLTESDGRITLKAEGKVRFIGGKKIRGAEEVTDPKTRSRFDEPVRGKIRQCNLAENGIKEPGGFVSRGFNREVRPSHTELFVDTVPMNLSQYPKRGRFMPISGYLQENVNEWGEKTGALEAGFRYDSERPRMWKKSSDIWVHGYWSWDWANSYERVAELNTDEMTVRTAPPYGNYAFKTGQRFCFLNVLEEVNEPGDYYIDRETGMLYFYPFAHLACEEIVLSVMDEPVLEMDGAGHIHVEGVTFEAVRGHAMAIKDAHHIRIDNCTFRNIGNYAIDVKGSRDVTIAGCTIHDTGDGGVSVVCGDRKTLTPADVSVYNNHIHHIAKWTRCYQTAINITGVGISATHNLIHDCPHTAILFWGNDMTIENNEIYSVVLETGDAGAIYTGRDYTFRGNRVCKNFIHHLGGVGMGTMGIYNDDCVSGTLMRDNFFYEVSRAVFLGGGRDFHVGNNVFIHCYPAIEADGRGASDHPVWRNMVDRTMKERYDAMEADRAPYAEKYPELADIGNLYRQNKAIPPSAVIENNLYCSERKLEWSADYEKGEFLLKSNCSCHSEDFEDFDGCDFRIRPDSPALRYGYRNVDFHAIGLVEEERKTNPPKVVSRMEIEQNSNRLALILKNLGGRDVKGRMLFHADKAAESFAELSVDMELTAHETKRYEIELPRVKEVVQIEARSDTAGVRPCRIRYRQAESA